MLAEGLLLPGEVTLDNRSTKQGSKCPTMPAAAARRRLKLHLNQIVSHANNNAPSGQDAASE